jgi:vacuolar-type H+-ATPase subunit H
MNIENTVAGIQRDSLPQPLAEMRGCVERLDLVEEVLAKLPAAPECAAVLAAVQALGETAVVLVKDIGPNASRRFNGFATSLTVEIAALEGVPIAPNERRQRIKEAIARTQKDAVDRTAEAFAAQGEALAGRCVKAMKDAKIAVERAIQKATGPLTLAGPMNIDLAVRVASLKDEMKGKSPAEWTRLYKGVIDRGETEDERVITLALSSLADAVANGSPPTMAKNYGPLDASVIRRLRTEAFAFQTVMAERRATLVPPHLAMLQTVIKFLDGCFWWLLGTRPCG